MKVTLDINEEAIVGSIEEGIKNIKPEELSHILADCLKEYFTKDNYANINKLLLQKSDSYYNNSTTVSEFAKQLVKSCDYSGLQDIVDKAIEALKNNYESILKTLLLESIVRGLTNTYSFNDNLQNEVSMMINDTISRMHNNQ